MRFGSVCSGIEAASVAWGPLGWKAAWFSEIEAFPNALLAHHWPDVPNLGDMTRLSEREEYHESEIDILVGGTPCQSFSVAGFRKGLRDKRGALALTFCEIAREKRPRWVVWENVPGVLSSNKGRDFGALLGALADCGYGLAYRVLDAQHFGVPQRRRRVFVVGHLGGAGDDRAEEVLFDAQDGFFDAQADRKTQREMEGPAPLACSPEGLGWECGGNLSYCLMAGSRDSIDAVYPVDEDELDALDTDAWAVLPGETSENDEALPLVRRLMPTEFEKLQGFPDGYTLIPYRGKPAEQCPDTPRYKALGNSMAIPVVRWIGERIAAIEGLPGAKAAQPPDPETVAKALSDSELVEKCVQGFHDLREAIPYLREARNRFAQPGRRVPVPGNPTWTEWVHNNLHVTVRRVQQLLKEPSEAISSGSKTKRRAGKLRSEDWRGLLKTTERSSAQVFGSLEGRKLAGAIRSFAQGIADRYAKPGGKLIVSVSIKARK
jgi:DNA (cytosine-5)-methyltransferase 1